MGYPARSVRSRHLASIAVGTLTFVYLLCFPLAIGRADESHLLHGARRVLAGDAIYRDFWEGITPLAFYLVAAMYAVGGTTLLVARVGFALIDAAGCALLFALVRRIAGPAEAVLAVLIVAGLALPVWPFASAHWLSTTLGLLVASVVLHRDPGAGGRARPLAAGALAGAAICVQQQRGVFLAAWLPVAFTVLGIAGPAPHRRRRLANAIGWSVVGATLVVALVLGHAAWRSSPAAMVDALFGFAVRNYAANQSGRVAWAGVPPLTELWAGSTWRWLLRIAPLFLIVEGALLARRGRWSRERRDRERAALWALALLMAVSVSYLPDFIHVAFVLPFLLLPAAAALHDARCASRPMVRRAMAAGMAVFAVAVAGHAVANLPYARALAPERFATAFGELQAEPPVAELYRVARRHLVREPDGRALLYSYPADAWLYLALGAEAAARFSVLVGGFFPDAYVAEVLETIRARQPGTIVLALPYTPDPVRRAVEAGYDAAADTWVYRIYTRRPDAPPAGSDGS